jgi:hypothetical protein
LVHRVLIYSGEGTGTSEELSHTEYVVQKLMEGYYYKGHSIYMDNYYNSVKLAHYLLEKQTYCTFTLRANRKNNPKAINDKKLKKGETICSIYRKGSWCGKMERQTRCDSNIFRTFTRFGKYN